MATMDTGVVYDDAAMREDLLAILQNISPTETQLVSEIGERRVGKECRL